MEYETVRELLEGVLLPTFKPKTSTFNATIQEEFMVLGTPYLDKGYIVRLLKKDMSNKSFVELCRDVFGTEKFQYTAVPECDLTPELFEKHYKFGVYPHVRQWLRHFADEGVVTTRAVLLGYVYESRG